MRTPLRSRISIGVGLGVLGWVAYGLTEYLFAALIPLLTDGNQTLPPWHWAVYGGLLLLYALAGAVTGGVAGALAPERKLRELISLVLCVAFLVSLAVVPKRSFSWLGLIVPAAVAVLVAIQVGKRASGKENPLVSPWVVSIALTAPFWLDKRLEASLSRNGRLLALAGLGLMALLTFGLKQRRWPHLTLLSTRHDALGVAALLPLLAAASWLNSGDALIGLPETNVSRTGAASRPNVVLIVLDTVRADHLSLHGYHRDTSPNLRRLAAHSTVYHRAISAGSMTLSSHGSMFTGQYASRHGAVMLADKREAARGLSRRMVTLAEILRQAGYRTAAVVANSAFLTPAFGFDQGFEVLDHRSQVAWTPEPFSKPFNSFLCYGVRHLASGLLATSRLDVQQRDGETITRNSASLLDQFVDGLPFFLFLNYFDAHEPYAVPEPFLSMFGNGLDPVPINGGRRTGVGVGQKLPGAEYRAHVVSRYDGAIAYVDAQVGCVLDHLKSIGQYDTSLIIVTSDHGQSLYEKGTYGHGQNVFQAQVHVPFIVKLPGSRTRRDSYELVSHVDLMPTILQVAGRRATDMDGSSLLLDERVRAGRHVFAESFPNRMRAVFRGDLKLLVSRNGGRELYRPWQDPAEHRNLYVRGHPSAGELEALLFGYLKRVPRQFPPGTLDDWTLDELRSLGYVQ